MDISDGVVIELVKGWPHDLLMSNFLVFESNMNVCAHLCACPAAEDFTLPNRYVW